MNKGYVKSFLIFLILVINLFTISYAGVKWEYYSKRAFEHAKATHKQIFLFAYTQTCPYCKLMDNSTFQNENLARYIHSRYVALRLDIRRNKEVANQYNLFIVPTMLVLEPNHSIVKVLYGYQSANQLLNSLQ